MWPFSEDTGKKITEAAGQSKLNPFSPINKALGGGEAKPEEKKPDTQQPMKVDDTIKIQPVK
jgi:hypothetical protein